MPPFGWDNMSPARPLHTAWGGVFQETDALELGVERSGHNVVARQKEAPRIPGGGPLEQSAVLDCLWLVQLHLKVEGDLYTSYVHVVSDTFSACVQARAHHAAWLYHSGLAPHIIPTGGLTGPPPTDSPGWHTPRPAATISCATSAPS